MQKCFEFEIINYKSFEKIHFSGKLIEIFKFSQPCWSRHFEFLLSDDTFVIFENKSATNLTKIRYNDKNTLEPENLYNLF